VISRRTSSTLAARQQQKDRQQQQVSKRLSTNSNNANNATATDPTAAEGLTGPRAITHQHQHTQQQRMDSFPTVN
jgi:hypothetical protein